VARRQPQTSRPRYLTQSPARRRCSPVPLNDDRVGRTLDRLFDGDRASLITRTVLGVVREFGIQTAQLHNDSTTVTVAGNYPDADGRDRGGKPTPAIRQGHNKDFRPDLKQLLFILTLG